MRLPKVYVVHIKAGHEQRERHITSELAAKNIPFEFMLDGDMQDLTRERLEKYFTGDMKKISPGTSCAMKHLLIYEELLRSGIPMALVLEDDVVLLSNFLRVMPELLDELTRLEQDKPGALILSLENSSLRFIPRSRREKGRRLYPETRGRCAAAYIINRAAAIAVLEHCSAHKCSLPIDWYHNELASRSIVHIYWCHPPLAEQGSFNGLFATSIDSNTFGLGRKIVWKVQKFYKYNILNFFR
jgi:glycosyl transferase family 25